MAGQVKHNKIFSAIRPDWRLAKLLFSLPRKNTDALIGAVARVLEDEGIRLVDSTLFLKPLLPEAGVLTVKSGYPPEDQLDKADLAAANWAWAEHQPLQIGTLLLGSRMLYCMPSGKRVLY
jgi:DUF1009 family protein